MKPTVSQQFNRNGLRLATAFLLVITLLAVTVPRMNRAPLKSDASLFMYAAQQIANGHPPYANYIIMHPPVPHLLGAGAILLGRVMGVPDVLSIRLLALVLCGLISLASYHLAQTAQPGLGPQAAVAASLSLLMLMVVWGSPVKLAMLLFYSLMLFALLSGRWFASGLFLSLALLSWGGAAFFTAIPLAFFLLLPGERARGAGKHLLGLLIAPVVIGVALGLAGTLPDFVAQFPLTFWEYVRNKLIGEGVRDPGVGLGNIFQKGQLARVDLFVLLTGLAGTVLFLVQQWKVLLRGRLQVVLFSTLMLSLSMVFLDYQSPLDLLPLVPVVAFGFALGFSRFMSFWERFWKVQANPLYALAVVVMLCGLRWPALGQIPDRLSLQRETAAWLMESGGLRYGIQAFGDLSLLILTDQENALPVIHAGPKTYLAMGNLGWSADVVVQHLGQLRPGIVVLDNRNENKSYLVPLSFFLTRNYYYIGSTVEPNLNIYAALDQPQAVRAALGIVQLLGPTDETGRESGAALSLPELAQVNLDEIVRLDEFHLIIAHAQETNLTLYWWSQPNTPYAGRVAFQWVAAGDAPGPTWVLSAVAWVPGAASVSHHPLPTALSPTAQLWLCVATTDSTEQAVNCEGRPAPLRVQGDYSR